jgi:hypothetical protein
MALNELTLELEVDQEMRVLSLVDWKKEKVAELLWESKNWGTLYQLDSSIIHSLWKSWIETWEEWAKELPSPHELLVELLGKFILYVQSIQEEGFILSLTMDRSFPDSFYEWVLSVIKKWSFVDAWEIKKEARKMVLRCD